MRLAEVHSAEQRRRKQERSRINNEHRVAAQERGHQSAKQGADSKIRRPRCGAEGIGGDQIFFCSDVGQHCGARGLKKRPHDGFKKQQRINQPHHRTRAHQQHRADDDGTQKVSGDHHFLAIQPVK